MKEEKMFRNGTIHVIRLTFRVDHYTPLRKHYKNHLSRMCVCNFWWRLRQKYVITERSFRQECFCVLAAAETSAFMYRIRRGRGEQPEA